MTATARVEIQFTLEGLGNRLVADFAANTTITPTVFTTQRRIQEFPDIEVALDLGDIFAVQLLIIKAVSKDLALDLDYVDATFDLDLTIPEGETAVIPRPAGTVYVKNADPAEFATYEYYVVGTS